MQGVLFKGECTDEAFDVFEKLTQESSVEVTGQIRAEPRRRGASRWAFSPSSSVSLAEPYPISPKEHGVEFLMENRHLWVRSQRQWAALRVRHEIMRVDQRVFR